MKVPPAHYKVPQSTIKGNKETHPLLIQVASMGVCKEANEFIMVTSPH